MTDAQSNATNNTTFGKNNNYKKGIGVQFNILIQYQTENTNFT